jgi:sugar phosphate isomerase/epimerase
MDRRTFLAATAAAAVHAARPLIGFTATAELGSIDGSVSGNNFTAAQFLDYLSSIKLTWAMISLPAAVQDDESAVRAIRAQADRLGIKLQLAHGSVCPSSRSFNAQQGTLEVQVARALKTSQIFGAKCMRCVLGGDPERPQIEMHIDNMIQAVRGLRSRIVDSGVKLAVENHGGDLQAREMKMMVEAVGTDVMGVCLDSGNPVWMLEDPHMTLEMLVPYAETSHVRDSAVWKTPEGINVRWVNMGDGNVDIDGWIKKFLAAKPGLPIIFENLVSGRPRVHAIYDPKFWDNWKKMPASEFSRFLAIADKGAPKPATPLPAGKTAGQQKIEDLEICVKYTRELLTRI